MGIYGTYGAFNGLGKPSIKLEFEDNESLVAFSKKMQDEEPASVQWNEEEEMFVPVEGYGDKYIVTDLRQRAKKEPGEVKSLTKFQFSKFKNAPELFEPVVSVSPSLFGVYPVFKGINNDIVYFDKEFSDNYNADFILKDYVINKSERLVTLNFARYKAYGTDGVSIVSVWSFSISCPVCNIITAYSSKIDAYFGLIEFTEGLIAVLKNAQSKLRSNSKDYKTLQFQIERWQDAANQYADGLGKAGDLYLVRDMRSNRARKEPGELAANKNLRFITLADSKIKNFDKELYYNTRSVFDAPENYTGKSISEKDGRYYIKYRFFVPTAKFKDDGNAIAGRFDDVEIEADVNKIHNLHLRADADIRIEDVEGKSDIYKGKFINYHFYTGYITKDYDKELQQKAFYVLFKQEFNDPNKTPYTKKLFLDFYANPTKYKIVRRDGYGDHTLPESWNEEYVGLKLNAEGLGAPGDTYIITDTRTRARKDLEDTAALKKYDIRKFSGEELQRMQTDDPLLYEQIKSDINTPATGIKDIIKICREKVGKSSILFHSEPDVWNLRLTVRDKKVFIILNYNDTDSNKIKQSITFNFANLDPKIFWSVNADEVSKLADLIKVEPLKWFITSFYPPLNDVIDYSFDFSAKDLKYFDLLYLCDTNDGEWWNYGFIASIGIDEFTNILGDKIRTLYAQGADKYDDVLLLYDVCLYVISDGERGADFQQVKQPIPEITGASYSHNGFDAVKILNSKGLADKYSDLGKTANDALYNNLDILDYRGMQPTYRQLSNYDGFFKPAANKNSLKGWGLTDTKKLIADICRNHYKECAAIAAHLKADTKLQSAFNLWHWLHHNIRYEYDREGREEVRTPARTWQDRHRGVDCDCLSVFAWCVLKCMSYNPAFELAAFKNKPAYSHIYINLDGIVVDRVWYVFNSRPPFITKTELFKVGMLDNLGQLF